MKGNTLPRAIISPLLLLMGMLLLVACRPPKELDAEVRLPRMKEEVLIHRLDSLSKRRPDYFYSKISSRYKDKELKVSFKTSVRMTSDSALNALITFARIPIYNSMVTPDTLTIVDKRGNCYMKEGMEYLKRTFDIDFEHRNIEEFLLGLPVGWDPDEKYYQINDPYNYIISSHNKRSLRRADKNITGGEVFIQYYLTPEADAVKRMIIDSPADTTRIKVNYFTREWVGDFLIPLESDITIYTPRDTIYIDLKYTKSTVNEPSELFLVIPDNYTRCE